MSKKKTVIDKAIEAFEQRGAVIKAKFDADWQAIQEGIAMLRNQQNAKTPRRKKAAPATTGA